MTSTIGELINQSIPHINDRSTIAQALDAMADADVEHIIVINDDREVVAIAEDIELEELNDDKLLSEVPFQCRFKGVNAQLHIYEALKLMSNNNWQLVPIIADDMTYLGAVNIDQIRAEAVENLAYKISGAIIVIRQMESDYSLAEIIRICESNDSRVLSVGTVKEEDSRAIYITLKLEKKDISSIIASFARYEYDVIASYGDDMYSEDLKDRLDLLMHYINM